MRSSLNYEMLKHAHTTEISPNDRALPPAIDTTLNSALGEWKTARTLLATTIQSYLAACTTFIAACAKPVYRPSERSDLEKILMMIDSELGSLVSKENTLQDIRMSLVTARNRSTTLVPVNTLPPEILANIFALSDTCFVRNNTQDFHNFAGVCVYWRELAMNTTDLWIHIDVGPAIPQKLTKTLLGRSKNGPIHIHVYEKRTLLASFDCVHGIIKMLAPHMHRVRTALLQSNSQSYNLVAPVLNLWLSSGNPNLVTSLTVYLLDAREQFSINESSVNALEDQPDNPRAVLRSLSRLHLENIKFDWDSVAYRGLVDLQLNCSCAPTSISVLQLANVLSASPELSILKLSSLKITSPENQTHPAPIELCCLRVLCLFCIDSAGLQLLLPLITLSSSAKVYISSTNFNHIYSQLEDFVARSRVAELYCRDTNYSHSFSTWRRLLRLPSCLRILGFRYFHTDGEPADQISASNSQYLSASSHPRVLLLDCMVTPEGLKMVLAESNTRSLHLELCRVYEGERVYSGNISMLLCEAYPGLTCIVSDTVSEEWEHCSMLD